MAVFLGRLSEHLGDDFFQRRVFDADVFERVVGEHGGKDLRDLLAVDAEFHAWLGLLDHFAVAGESLGIWPSSKRSVSTLWLLKRSMMPASEPSYTMWPWLMTTTRRQRAATSFM